MNTTYQDIRTLAKTRIKEILMIMTGLSEEGFNNRMMHDPYFVKGFDLLVSLLVEVEDSKRW